MKVLVIAGYISLDNDPDFSKVKSGFGYMVMTIARAIAKCGVDVDLWTSMVFHNKREIEGVTCIPWSMKDLVSSIGFKDIVSMIRYYIKYPSLSKSAVWSAFHILTKGFLRITVPEYDIVHIHGISAHTAAVVSVCREKKVPVLVTAHGLNSFSGTVKMEPIYKKFEKDFFREAVTTSIPISFISSGDMNVVLKYLELSELETFYMISNGTALKEMAQTIDIRKRYGIKKDDFVFLFVGNISLNKNQRQVVEAFDLLPPSDKEKTKVFLCGGQMDGGEVVSLIKEKHLDNSLIYAGFIPNTDIHNYYAAANATILSSLSEGFGLSIIEGYVYGKPSLAFKDMSAIQELFSEEAMICPKDRQTTSLAEGMVKMMKVEWNSDRIKAFSRQFSVEGMADKYIALYKKLIS